MKKSSKNFLNGFIFGDCPQLELNKGSRKDKLKMIKINNPLLKSAKI